jgi:hypothetical protein
MSALASEGEIGGPFGVCQLWRRQRFHSITLSARASNVGGTTMPKAFAVFTLTASSKSVGCSTGGSAGDVLD